MKKRLSCLILAIIMICSFIPSVSAAGSVLSSQGKTLYELGLFRGVGTNEDGTPDFGLDQVPTRNQASRPCRAASWRWMQSSGSS